MKNNVRITDNAMPNIPIPLSRLAKLDSHDIIRPIIPKKANSTKNSTPRAILATPDAAEAPNKNAVMTIPSIVSPMYLSIFCIEQSY